MPVEHSPRTSERRSARIRGLSPPNPYEHTRLGAGRSLVAPTTELTTQLTTQLATIDEMANNENEANPLGAFANFEALLQILRNTPTTPVPEYSGNDHEDPKKFINRCDEYFVVYRTREAQKTATAATGLRGEAEKWWNIYKPLDFDWPKFQELLISQYDSPAIVSRLNSQLFSRKQGDKEAAGMFLQHKCLLYQRIRSTEPEETKVATLLELLRPEIRMTIRPSNPRTVSVLLTKAIEAEYDLADRYQPTKSKSEEKKVEGIRKLQHDSSQLPQCRYCPERHFHRDCPILAARRLTQQFGNPENATRAAAPPKPAAPSPN